MIALRSGATILPMAHWGGEKFGKNLRSLKRTDFHVKVGQPFRLQVEEMVTIILRDKEYEVRSGMTLLSALKKIDILPEAVIATRGGELIEEDEILREGETIKLVAVISGG